MQSTSACVRRSGDDRNEVGCGQASTTDEGAVDVANAEDLSGVRSLDRPSVQDSDLLARRSETIAQLCPDRFVHVCDFRHRRDLARADGPDRLVGDGELRLSFEIVGYGAIQLG